MRDLILPVIYVFLGGGAGSVCRFLVAFYMQRNFQGHLPWSTLLVNVIGSFLIGLILVFLQTRNVSFPYWRQLLTIGFLGGFTTFSSFSWDTLTLFKNHETGMAFLNIAANLILCLIAAWIGGKVGEWVN